MINNIVVVGRLTKDPQLFSKDETDYVSLCLAIDRPSKRNEQQQNCDFLFCKAFGNNAKNIHRYLSKGALVGVTGHMRSSKYEKEGQMHFVTEIIIDTIKFMSSKVKQQQNQLIEPCDQDATDLTFSLN